MSWPRRLLRWGLILAALGLVLSIAAVGIAYWLVAPRLPDVAEIRDIKLQVPLRVLSAEAQKKAPGPEASILKIKGTEVQQALSELMMYAVGPYALPFERGSREEGDLRSIAGPAYAAPLAATYCNYRKVSIYGGSNEIQRNIISQMILGL